MPRFLAPFSFLKRFAAELNLLKNEASYSNAFNSRTATITTRVYLPTLTIAVLILITYTVANGHTRIITFTKPSCVLYEVLLAKTHTTLQCPCSRISVAYGSFITISTQYHPICTSVFVSDEWINLLFNPNSSYFIPFDFRAIAHGHFRTLSTLCSFATRSMHDAIVGLATDTLLTPQIIRPESLIEQSKAHSDFF